MALALFAFAFWLSLGSCYGMRIPWKTSLKGGLLGTLFPQPTKGSRWAVLMAGSAGWWNYRHQADVAHAYQVLVAGGVKPRNIITIMVHAEQIVDLPCVTLLPRLQMDDVARDRNNPYPGQLFNNPSRGVDVYKGLRIDYSGENATAQVLYQVGHPLPTAKSSAG